jgi:sterol desaturase/sphingolipid hydroxylase (fatty acid hydroxylase superfamily)
MSFVVSLAALTGVYLVVGFLERRPALQLRTLPSPRPYLATDVGWFMTAMIATVTSVFVLRPQLSKLRLGPIRHALAGLPVVGKVLIGLIVFDFVSFVVHLCLHRFGPLWAVHKVHHSSLHLDGLATARTHMLENMLRFVPGQAFLFLVGMPVPAVTATVAIAAIYGVSNHSNVGIDLRWLEPVFVTPRLHHRHHVPSTSQSNYGVVFTIWDRLFGTLVRRDTAPSERFGVPGEIDSYPQHFLAAFRQPLMQHCEPATARRADVGTAYVADAGKRGDTQLVRQGERAFDPGGAQPHEEAV